MNMWDVGTAGIRAGLVGIAALLCGCAMTDAQRAKLDPGVTAVAAEEGLVAIRVITNTTAAPVPLRSATLSIQPEGGGTNRVAQSKAAPSASSALFIEALPPGRYQAIQLNAGGMIAPLVRQVSSFEVQAGRITDLGALVLVFESVGARGGKYRVAHLPSPQDTAASLAVLPPELLARLNAKPALLQGEPISPLGNAIVLRDALALTSITARSAYVEGRPAAFGRTLGVVSVWDPERTLWTHYSTGRSLTVRSLAFARDGALLVGFDEGVLMMRRGAAWRALPSPVKSAPILFIEQASSGEYFALVEDRSAFVVLSSASPESGAWTELRRIPGERFLNPFHNPRAQAVLAGERLLLFVYPGGTAGHVLHSFSLAARQWETRQLEFDNMLSYTAFSDGTVAGPAGGTAYGRTIPWSSDGGKTWTRRPMENWSQLPVFRDASRLYVHKIDKLGMTGPPDLSLSKSVDGGVKWTPVGVLPKYFQQIHTLPRPGWLLLQTGIGETHVSSDDGVSWQYQPMGRVIPIERAGPEMDPVLGAPGGGK